MQSELIGTAMTAGCIACVVTRRWPLDLAVVILQHAQAAGLWAWFEIPAAVKSRWPRYWEYHTRVVHEHRGGRG